MNFTGTFVIVQWPEIQELMDIEGFEENSCLINEEPFLSEYGSSAYFVRQCWLESINNTDPYANCTDKELQDIFEDMQADAEVDRLKSEGYEL